MVVVHSIKGLLKVELLKDNIQESGHNMLLAKLEGKQVFHDTTTLNKADLLLIHNLGNNGFESFYQNFGDDFICGG